VPVWSDFEGNWHSIHLDDLLFKRGLRGTRETQATFRPTPQMAKALRVTGRLRGGDIAPYLNEGEAPGSVSYAILHPGAFRTHPEILLDAATLGDKEAASILKHYYPKTYKLLRSGRKYGRFHRLNETQKQHLEELRMSEESGRGRLSADVREWRQRETSLRGTDRGEREYRLSAARRRALSRKFNRLYGEALPRDMVYPWLP
jgi:hypothetical protein